MGLASHGKYIHRYSRSRYEREGGGSKIEWRVGNGSQSVKKSNRNRAIVPSLLLVKINAKITHFK